jgi:hypothetical protein
LKRISTSSSSIGCHAALNPARYPTLYYGDELGLENGHIPPEKGQDPQCVVLLNFSDETCQVALPQTTGQVVLSTYLDRVEAVDLSDLTVRPYAGLLIVM